MYNIYIYIYILYVYLFSVFHPGMMISRQTLTKILRFPAQPCFQPGKRLYGEDYEWIHHASSQYCGESTLERKDSVNVVTYDAVSIYKGQPDSIVGTTFMSFLVLLLFIWGMLLIEEFRAIYNLMYVIWYVPSIEDSNTTFASIDDGKLFVRRQGLHFFQIGNPPAVTDATKIH